MMKYAAAAAACIGMAVAPVNEYVVRTSVPEQVDGDLIAFTAVSHRGATISWSEPGLGDWQWPILGYEIQVSAAVTWTAPADGTNPYELSDDSSRPYDYAVDWSTCPDGESGTLNSMGVANLSPWDGPAGCTLNSVTTATTAGSLGTVTTQHVIPGLKADTVYYFRIRARNHDGTGDWSEPSYGLLTHSKPETPYAPEIYQVSDTTMTVHFDEPATTGTNSCDDIAAKATAGVASYLSAEACTTLTSDAGPMVDPTDDRDCMATSGALCQTTGAGSEVTGYRILISEGAGNTNYVELKGLTTGLSLYPMYYASGDSAALLGLAADDHDLSYTIEGLSPDTVYNVVVKATNAAGESDASAPVTGKTLSKPNTPEPPTSTEVDETEITLTWDTTVANCVYESTVPLPTPAYLSLNNDYPNTPTQETTCPLDNNVALTGFRLFASSYSVLGTTSGGAWEPARRGSLTDDSSGTAYVSSPLDSVLPTGADDGSWLEIDVSSYDNTNGYGTGSFTVDSLSQDTYYKFKILFTNAVGDSDVSAESEYFLTLEAPVADLKMHSSPPCIYEDGSTTTFVATSTGTNVFYKWQMPDGLQTNAHDVRSFGSVIAEAGTVVVGGGSASDPDEPGSGAYNPDANTRCKTTDCSVMEFVLPSVAPQQQLSGETPDHTAPDTSDDFTLSLIGYNTRGQVVVSTTYNIQYCGCTDPWDPAYWDQATYHLPAMCDHESWDGADMTVIEGEFQYYQTFYEENTHSAQVIVRVDEGSVDLYASTDTVPDPAMDSTYFDVTLDIQNFKVLEIDYSDLAGSRTLYLAIQGASGAAFSRFSVVSSTRDFTRGRGERYGGSTVTGSTDLRRTQLLNIEPQAFEIKTPYYDFFEYYFGRADNDLDVEIKVNCQMGCVNVYTSKIERFPSALRTTTDYTGYWTGHNGVVCATDGTSVATYATASFDGLSGVYGMVSFEQAATGGEVIVSVSLKGFGNRAATWEITESAVGDQSTAAATADSCASTGATFKALPADGLAGTDQIAGDTIYTSTVTSSELELFGDSVADETSETSGSHLTAPDSIIGRSVKITLAGSPDLVVCATIFPDASVESLLGELSLMHTIRPEETIETCMTTDGTPGDCTGASAVSAERLLFASVQGADSYAVGDEQVNNEYTIEAKIYRYRVESNLLEPTTAAGANGGTVSVADAEDRRYSVVSLDNFNYYEVELSPAAYGITVEFTLAYGRVELYTSKDKLPTQDPLGHDQLYGDVHGAVACPLGACTYYQDDGDTWAAALGQSETFIEGRTYRIDIPFSQINEVGKYVFLGVLGVAPDSSYTISVTEYLFQDTMGESLTNGAPVTATVPAEEYSFFTLYVGPMDETMYVTERSHAGHRTGDLGTDPDTWGIDWNEPLVPTWIEQQQDEWDLDVDVQITGLAGGVVAFGSSREPYPSAERGYDVTSTTGSITIPHFTFSDKTVYISLYNPTGSPVDVSFTPNVLEMHQDHLTADTPTDLSPYACPGTPSSCTGQGSCVDGTCYCDNGFLGDDCSIEAFSSDTTNQPNIGIANLLPLSLDSGAATALFSGDSEVLVPFTLANLPSGSKVHVYVDGLPYPAKGANVLYYPAGGDLSSCTGVASETQAAGCQQIEVYGMAAGVLHTVELLLLSSDNIPLGTDMVDFKVNFAGGCSNGCSSNGVCHHGYCVCFDGYSGIDCSTNGEDPTNFVPGAGFVAYNTELMQQERDEDAYISKLKLDANSKFLEMSDSQIASAHAAVVTKLNDFVKDNDSKMAALATSQDAKATELHRKRDRITTTIQQMREESKRLKTANTEAYLETVRALHEGQRQMQNELDAKRLQHFQNMAVRHDEWVEIKEKNDFKLNQLRTANGPLVNIDDLEERECTQDDMFRTSCVDVQSSTAFVTQPGYTSHGTIAATGTCTEAEALDTANAERQGYRCVCSYDADQVATCVRVEVDGEDDATLYDDIPR
jgi:hypothetical protein